MNKKMWMAMLRNLLKKVQKKNRISARKEGKCSPSRSHTLYSAKLNLHALNCLQHIASWIKQKLGITMKPRKETRLSLQVFSVINTKWKKEKVLDQYLACSLTAAQPSSCFACGVHEFSRPKQAVRRERKEHCITSTGATLMRMRQITYDGLLKMQLCVKRYSM